MQNYCFLSGAIVKNKLYILTEESGDFIKIDIDSNEAEYVCVKKELALPQSAVIFSDEEYVFAILMRGKYLFKYSVASEKGEYFYLGLERKLLYLSASVMKWENELIIVPIRSNSIVHIDINTGKVELDEIVDTTYREGDLFFGKCNEIEGSDMWLFSNRTREVIRYNVLTKEKIYYKYPMNVAWVADAEIRNGKFYMLDEWGNVICWEMGSSAETILKNPNGRKKIDISTLHVAGKVIWLMPSCGKEIICFNMEDNEYKIQEYYPEKFSYIGSEKMAKYPQKIQTSQWCFFSMHAGNYIFSVNQITGEGRWRDTIWPKKLDTEEYLRKKNVNCVQEEIIFPELIGKYVEGNQTLRVKTSELGKKIWDSCIHSI